MCMQTKVTGDKINTSGIKYVIECLNIYQFRVLVVGIREVGTEHITLTGNVVRYGQQLLHVLRILQSDTKKRVSSEISPTRCNNCVFILRNGFTLLNVHLVFDDYARILLS